NPTDPDDAGRLQGLDRLDECRDRLSVLRERTLKVREILARGDEQTIDIEEGVATSRFVYIHAGFSHGLADQLCNSGSRRASAEKQEPLIGDFLLCDAQRGQDTSQRHSRGALDVVIERTDLVAVTLEERYGIDVCKVFPLDAAFWVELLHRRHELINERRVFVAADAALPQSQVEWVVEQSLVVRADVDNDRQAVLRWHAGTGRAKSEFPDRDAHAASAEIPQPEDALAVGDHDEAHVIFGPIGQKLLNAAAGADRQIDAARLAEDMAEFLARLANRRRIHNRHVGCRVRHQDRVVERLVACLQI